MRRLNTILVILVIAAAALVGWVATRSGPDDVRPAVADDGAYSVGSIAGGGEDVVRAAAEALPIALTYDYRTLEDDLAAATERMTSSFAEEFTDTFRKTAQQLATEKKGVTQALVRAAVLVSEGDGKAVALVYVDQLLVSSEQSQQDKGPIRVTKNRVLVDLVEVDGAWKIDNIRPF
ncbi:MAG TPA: hypothetical protein VLI04_21445 [Nocardioidaceae bacterium]|nr:hypothetical protein [Nocardioidaceae bacterium]